LKGKINKKYLMASNNSVPSASGKPAAMPNAQLDEFGKPLKHHDSILMYCSYFTYDQNNERAKFCHDIKVTEIVGKLNQHERNNMISPGTSASIDEFLKADDKQQRFIMDDPN